MKIKTKIIGTGGYLPKKIRKNTDLENIINTSNEWILSRTGIKERRIACSNENVATMGLKASLCALKMANINKNKIELIIVATTTSNYAFPSTACIIQDMLNIKNIIAFDISAACSGFIYAISIAEQYIKSKFLKYALVIGTDTLSKFLDPKDRSTLVLFGDGAGAVVLSASQTPGIISTRLHASGKHRNLLLLKQNQNFDKKQKKNFSYIKMNGNEIFKIAVNNLVEVVKEILLINNVKIQSLDWFIPHQANIRIIYAIAKKLNIDIKKIIITLDYQGNTSSASIPLALNKAVVDGRIKKGQLILLEAFGAGLTWGATLIRF